MVITILLIKFNSKRSRINRNKTTKIKIYKGIIKISKKKIPITFENLNLFLANILLYILYYLFIIKIVN